MQYDSDEVFSPLDATVIAENSFYEVVDNPYFRDSDAQVIYRMLLERMTLPSFGFYLKRLIYQKARMTEPFDDVSEKVFQSIILDSFLESRTPFSFESISTKPGAITKNWLRQKTVKRSVVLLIGFGLDLTADEVNDLLDKGLREAGLNVKEPREAICLYCRQRQLPYAKYYQLWQRFSQQPVNMPNPDENSIDTMTMRSHFSEVKTEEDLLHYLLSLRTPSGDSRHSVSAKRAFDKQYAVASRLTAELLNAAEAEDNRVKVSRLREILDRDDSYYEESKQERIERLSRARKTYTMEDITPGDIEKVLCAAIPIGVHNNLLPIKASTLNEQFSGKRFSRQHVTELLAGRAAVDRFDLLTLIFYNYSQQLGKYPLAQKRYSAFIDECNHVLQHCGMGPLYLANPYESFLLMCILSSDPLGTYADVWELSYQKGVAE